MVLSPGGLGGALLVWLGGPFDARPSLPMMPRRIRASILRAGVASRTNHSAPEDVVEWARSAVAQAGPAGLHDDGLRPAPDAEPAGLAIGYSRAN
ncbi:hypothetical protein XH98_25695 [Bradyrhizobium sp. CCBAU 51745]|nr:hypothetical protein [Bradyrhizobium sp. CCBAU 45384]MDA9442431.1 hypothetical protein [Bradyrhizobium sp. CCBAU 51745]